MSKVIQAFWEKRQVWPELCPKEKLIDGNHTYKHSCAECIIDGNLPCCPDIHIAWRSPAADSFPQEKKRRGRERKGEWRCCPVCWDLFYVPRWRIEKGEGYFCSNRCKGLVTGCPAGVSFSQFKNFKNERQRIEE